MISQTTKNKKVANKNKFSQAKKIRFLDSVMAHIHKHRCVVYIYILYHHIPYCFPLFSWFFVVFILVFPWLFSVCVCLTFRCKDVYLYNTFSVIYYIYKIYIGIKYNVKRYLCAFVFCFTFLSNNIHKVSDVYYEAKKKKV